MFNVYACWWNEQSDVVEWFLGWFSFLSFPFFSFFSLFAFLLFYVQGCFRATFLRIQNSKLAHEKKSRSDELNHIRWRRQWITVSAVDSKQWDRGCIENSPNQDHSAFQRIGATDHTCLSGNGLRWILMFMFRQFNVEHSRSMKSKIPGIVILSPTPDHPQSIWFDCSCILEVQYLESIRVHVHVFNSMSARMEIIFLTCISALMTRDLIHPPGRSESFRWQTHRGNECRHIIRTVPVSERNNDADLGEADHLLRGCVGWRV
jgi:hypothetical protein